MEPMTPHEAIVDVLNSNVYEYSIHGTINAGTVAVEVVAALREGAVDRVLAKWAKYLGSDAYRLRPDARNAVAEILGPENVVNDDDFENEIAQNKENEHIQANREWNSE